MHIPTYFKIRRGDRRLSEAVAATGINRGTLSRIENGKQFPEFNQVEPLAWFYDFATAQAFLDYPAGKHLLIRLYPASVLRCIQLERDCACGCGKSLPPDSLRTKRYVSGHRKHVRRA